VTVTIDLSGRVAVVTGGGGGIGGATSEVLAAAGAHVVVADIDASLAEERVAAITGAGRRAEAFVVDVRDAEQVAALERAVVDGHGGVDVLVNNVGHYLQPTPFADGTPEHWSALHAVNFEHILLCTHAFLPGMVERGRGSIINVSSVESLRGYPADPVYGAYKAAATHFTRCLALEVASHGVRVNGIAPDVTQSIQVDYDQIFPPELQDRWPIWVPVGRMGQPADNADVVLFLASDLSRFVTGHVIPTDGGTLVAGGWFRTLHRGRWTNSPRNP
jgi:2-hydroxycyclohexanecarboxyl-CoA dehydrogenase